MNKKGFKIIGPDGKELTDMFDISGKSIATQFPEGVKVSKDDWQLKEVTFTVEAIDVEKLRKALGVDDESLRELGIATIIKFVQILGDWCKAREFCSGCPFCVESAGSCLLSDYSPEYWCDGFFESELSKNGYKFPENDFKITWINKAVKDEKVAGRA